MIPLKHLWDYKQLVEVARNENENDLFNVLSINISFYYCLLMFE